MRAEARTACVLAFSLRDGSGGISAAEVLQQGADRDGIAPTGQARRRAIARQVGERMGRGVVEDADQAVKRQWRADASMPGTRTSADWTAPRQMQLSGSSGQWPGAGLSDGLLPGAFGAWHGPPRPPRRQTDKPGQAWSKAG